MTQENASVTLLPHSCQQCTTLLSNRVTLGHALSPPGGGAARVPDKFQIFSEIFLHKRAPVKSWWFPLKRFTAPYFLQKLIVSDVKKLGGFLCDSCIFPILKTGEDDACKGFRKFFYSSNPICPPTIFQFPNLASLIFWVEGGVGNDGCKAFLAPQLGNSADTSPLSLSPTNISRSISHSHLLKILKPRPCF